MIDLIMIVDDDEDDVDFFRSAMHSIEPAVNCLSASGAREAIDILEHLVTKPAYVFIDINMPRVSGIELVCQLRKIRDYDEVKLVIYSTTIPHLDDSLAHFPGVDFFLNKPTGEEELEDSIRSIIEHGVPALSGSEA